MGTPVRLHFPLVSTQGWVWGRLGKATAPIGIHVCQVFGVGFAELRTAPWYAQKPDGMDAMPQHMPACIKTGAAG